MAEVITLNTPMLEWQRGPVGACEHALWEIWNAAKDLRRFSPEVLEAAGAEQAIQDARHLLAAARGRFWLHQRQGLPSLSTVHDTHGEAP